MTRDELTSDLRRVYEYIDDLQEGCCFVSGVETELEFINSLRRVLKYYRDVQFRLDGLDK